MPKGEKSSSLSPTMLGERFHRLTVINRSPQTGNKNDSSARWVCQCDCGKQSTVSRRALKSGRIKSCGCLRLDMNRSQAKSRRSAGISSPVKRLVRTYKSHAKNRGLEFDLSYNLFVCLISTSCYYCGDDPSQVSKTIRGDDKEHILVYNGIDRVNNDIGYVESNCVPSCGKCNRIKSDLSLEDFKERISKIYRKLMISC